MPIFSTCICPNVTDQICEICHVCNHVFIVDDERNTCIICKKVMICTHENSVDGVTYDKNDNVKYYTKCFTCDVIIVKTRFERLAVFKLAIIDNKYNDCN